jgi:enoyl-CoA hydratase
MSIRVHTRDRVTTVMIDRPERRNAVDPATAIALADAFRAFDADPVADVAVLCGAGGTFCAGFDLKTVAEGPGNRRPLRPGDAPMGPTRMLLSKPVIAAVSGYAVAGGIELALWCDLRVMEETATLGVFCRRWGVPLMDGGTVRLARLIGMARALDIVLTGRPVDAAEAERIGLATRVVPHGRAREEAEALARELAALPQTCLRSDRQSVYETWAMPLDAALARENELGVATIRSGETLAGAKRFASGEGRHGAPATGQAPRRDPVAGARPVEHQGP